MSNYGCCYVAWGETYIQEAIRSARSLKYPTCLFTDLETKVPENVFTYIKRTDFAIFQDYHYFYRKLIALQQSPFDITMYLDSDTCCLDDLELGFEQANKYNFATVIAPGQVFQYYHPKMSKVRDYIHYNAGVLWFKYHPINFVEKVLAIAKDFNHCDEPAWSIAWDELNINPAVLPNVFNFIEAGYIHDRPIRIWHSRQPIKTHLVHHYVPQIKFCF